VQQHDTTTKKNSTILCSKRLCSNPYCHTCCVVFTFFFLHSPWHDGGVVQYIDHRALDFASSIEANGSGN